MPSGLYGKLPAKRDFIAVGTSRGFLKTWEYWMQAGLSSSRMALGQAWQDAFLRAPIWRFWLGARICGEPVLGAFMPSVDGIGRYFPLTLFHRTEAGDPLPPPEYDDFADWFDRAEAVLLSALAQGARFEDVAEAADRLPAPDAAEPDPAQAGATRLRDGTLVAPADAGAFPRILTQLRAGDRGRVHSGMSYWWTTGGEGFAPHVAATLGMPSAEMFAGMLTGRFDGETP
ncbi:type VI secretion system-associated protein TagF [Methylobacterium sp. J-068]|uniref:type VI secretion system-associated protein TagF n=1 Tax=Methylobacterium sp. J-068 TaxID=2836649 RepID=UPI001FBA7EB7|nr:type VI secretion system-associated protein TagF [Methylobacterium sp. J-068]MCJ2033870.1 type VI secretion system-associated protein TagF [Methylobacterium sp. J-068]